MALLRTEVAVETFVIVMVIAVTIFAVGAAFGAGIQDSMAEDQRRRLGERHRELKAIITRLREQAR
jgi:hypothetical protein